jgi:hypothetical protein
MSSRLAASSGVDRRATFQPVASGVLRRTCSCGGQSGGECESCRRRERLLRRQAHGVPEHGAIAPPIVHEVLGTPGQALPPRTRVGMEQRFGHDFTRVRIHTDDAAVESARRVSALAYTVGRHIVFGAGQYAPETPGGARLLAHELSHVVQQAAAEPRISGGSSVSSMAGPASSSIAIGSAHDVAERNADAMAAVALGRNRVTAIGAPVRDSGPTLRAQPAPDAASEAAARNAKLNQLATRPALALRQWRGLSQADRDSVLFIMIGRYGAPFTQEFQNYAKGIKKPRPGPAGVLKGPEYTPKWLFDRGYRHAYGELWVHPSGEELTVLPPATKNKEPEPEPDPEKKCPTKQCFDNAADSAECEECCQETYPDSEECQRYCKTRCADVL